MSCPPLIAADNISVRRRGKAVLHEVSLRVERHDFVTVLGPNGAGKTTLLKCLIGLHKPDGGTVMRTSGLKIGYVPQRLAVAPDMPLRVRAFFALRRRAVAAVIDRTAEETGVASLLDKPLYELSGGELQRVLMARALLEAPDLLVLDEPTQNLDVSGQLAFYRLLARLYEQRQFAILMVSHDLHLVMAATRRVVCLYHHVCCHGAPHVVAQDPEFIALLGNDMARLTAVYHHAHDHQHD